MATKQKTRSKKATTSKKTKAKRLGVMNVKLRASTRARLIAKAKRHADGNLSAWVRHAAERYAPKRGEKISLTAI